MKKMLSNLSALFLLAMLLTGCSQGPADVAESFFDDLAEGEVTAAKELATPTTVAILDMMVTMGQANQLGLKDLELVDEQIDGVNATVTFRDKKGATETVKLMKIDGEWKVHLEK